MEIRRLVDWEKNSNLPAFIYGTTGIGKTTLANVLLKNYHM